MRRKRIRGDWGGLNAKFIAEMLGMTLITTKRLLYAEKQSLGRTEKPYLSPQELALFIHKQSLKKYLYEFNKKFNLGFPNKF